MFLHCSSLIFLRIIFTTPIIGANTLLARSIIEIYGKLKNTVILAVYRLYTVLKLIIVKIVTAYDICCATSCSILRASDHI
ncbi:hypothetical protein BDF19DRAFT_453834 [Syncephalis fuscata]|nr:hypothetical protein BDF19DRAFT_453834 [Syncephalis fuscata]